MLSYIIMSHAGEEKMKQPPQLQVYVRRWQPSTHTVGRTGEVVLDKNTTEHLKEKISEFSGIPVKRVMFARVRPLN